MENKILRVRVAGKKIFLKKKFFAEKFFAEKSFRAHFAVPLDPPKKRGFSTINFGPRFPAVTTPYTSPRAPKKSQKSQKSQKIEIFCKIFFRKIFLPRPVHAKFIF